MPTAEPIETTATEEPYAPSAVPRGGPDRSDVLTQARLLAAECAGFAALVEGAVGKARPEFIQAWRAWYGSWLGRHIALERLPMIPAQADDEVRRWQQRLAAWRQGLAYEPGMAPQTPQSAPAPQTAPAEKKGWPTWAILLALGGGGVVLWKVGQWVFSSPYQSTGAAISDVVDTGSTLNDVRKARQSTR